MAEKKQLEPAPNNAELAEISGNEPGLLFELPKSAIPTPEIGPNEKALLINLQYLRDQGVLTAEHEARAAVAITAARTLDRAEGKGRPSGTAMLVTAYDNVLSKLPVVDQSVKKSNELGELIREIKGAARPRDLKAVG
ncbi:hypothetical protein ACUH93_07080 [Dermabacteraceae bacterium P7006]